LVRIAATVVGPPHAASVVACFAVVAWLASDVSR